MIQDQLAGMKFPASQQDYLDLLTLNIGLIVCLNEVLPSFSSTVFENSPDKPVILHVSINDYGTPQSLDPIDQMILRVKETLDSNRAVVCHCMAGLSRTGMIISCILVSLFGMNSTQAVQLV